MDGQLAEQFAGVGFKRLSAVDCISEGKSNQHELNVSVAMRSFLGDTRRTFECTYFRFAESFTEGAYDSEESTATYYNARERQLSRSPEFRLVYPSTSMIMRAAKEGDYCWVFRRIEDDRLLVVVAEDDSPVGRQLDRLVGTDMRVGTANTGAGQGVLALGSLDTAADDDLSVEDADLLTALGLTVTARHPNDLAKVIDRFGGSPGMPTTKDFAAFARNLCRTASPVDDPDRVLHDWYTFTTEMFFGYESHVLQPILDGHFAMKPAIDVSLFFDVAKRHMNSRYSRAGYTFEHHISALLDIHGLAHQRMTKRLADGSKPDFLFPGSGAYSDADVPVDMLTFLGAKTTTKERWMQVVAEAPRIRARHLATMDRELNGEILDAMAYNDVFPVIPEPIVKKHYMAQRQILTVADFLLIVTDKQRRLTASGIRLA